MVKQLSHIFSLLILCSFFLIPAGQIGQSYRRGGLSHQSPSTFPETLEEMIPPRLLQTGAPSRTDLVLVQDPYVCAGNIEGILQGFDPSTMEVSVELYKGAEKMYSFLPIVENNRYTIEISYGDPLDKNYVIPNYYILIYTVQDKLTKDVLLSKSYAADVTNDCIKDYILPPRLLDTGASL